MDELKEIWGKINEAKQPEEELTTDQLQQIGSQQSLGVISKLSRNVRAKMYYAIFFTVAFGTGLPFVFPLASQILLLIMIAAYLIGSILLYQEYKILQAGIDMTQDILSGLQAYRDRIKRVLKYEELVALCLYPVSVTAGFLFGMQVVDREARIMNQTLHWVALILSIVVMTIGGHMLARWMNKKAFGKYLDQLEGNIHELEGAE